MAQEPRGIVSGDCGNGDMFEEQVEVCWEISELFFEPFSRGICWQLQDKEILTSWPFR